MPTSFWKHISYVIEQGRSIMPKSFLDIGIGNGKWGFLFREYLDIYGRGANWKKDTWTTRIDGIEIYEPYITENPTPNNIYDNIYIGNATEILPTLPDYDLMTMMDVLEHIDKAEGEKLVNMILEKSKMFVLSVPLGDWRYEFDGENKFESHISVWEEDELVNYPNYKQHKVYRLPTGKREVQIGVFIYERK